MKKFSQAEQDIISYLKSHGSYVNARTGRITIRGAKPKEGVVASNEKAHGKEALTGGKVAKVRNCPPRCIVCCAMNNPCLLSLCTKRIGNRKTTCFECFHQIQDLSDLQGNRDASATKTSSWKKRKTTDTEDT